jgi:hypothetical protein
MLARPTDSAAEAGVETAAAYRRKGFGAKVTAAWAAVVRTLAPSVSIAYFGSRQPTFTAARSRLGRVSGAVRRPPAYGKPL